MEKNFHNKFIFEFAESADEALELVDYLIDSKVDILLIISDYQMPGMKGDEFAGTLKKKLPEVNIVMLTGQMPGEISTVLLENKIILNVIQKPWNENDLINLINKVSEEIE